MIIQGYTLVNEEKIGRALNGVEITDKQGTRVVGGVGNGAYNEEGVWKRDGDPLSEEDARKLEFSLLAEYDKLGGLIKRGDDKVKMGSFYEFKAKKPRQNPKVSFVYKVNGKNVEVPDGSELPGEVKAVKILAKVEAEAKGKKKIKK